MERGSPRASVEGKSRTLRRRYCCGRALADVSEKWDGWRRTPCGLKASASDAPPAPVACMLPAPAVGSQRRSTSSNAQDLPGRSKLPGPTSSARLSNNARSMALKRCQAGVAASARPRQARTAKAPAGARPPPPALEPAGRQANRPSRAASAWREHASHSTAVPQSARPSRGTRAPIPGSGSSAMTFATIGARRCESNRRRGSTGWRRRSSPPAMSRAPR
mmetsp:Transcript_60165/g.179142  ORF Transcript_60165/g.179142 Transcript_60165/m.179142 type:complete len:220 (-) Transcript_60165:394-1053(-)